MIGFTEYLNAREPLDKACMDPAMWERVARELESGSCSRVVDIGAGTGAMVRYMLERAGGQEVHISAVERSPAALREARRGVVRYLKAAGVSQVEEGENVIRWHGEWRGTISLCCADLFEEHAFGTEPAEIVTAKSFCDMVPLQPAVSKVAALLRNGGLFYAPINYNGKTSLGPAVWDPEFEERLLARYDRSMDERCVRGLPVGGSRTGTTLLTALRDGGFEIVGFGASDWCVQPIRGCYAPSEYIAARAILETIEQEASHHPELPPQAVRRWFDERVQQLERGELYLMIHHTDVAARKRGGEAQEAE